MSALAPVNIPLVVGSLIRMAVIELLMFTTGRVLPYCRVLGSVVKIRTRLATVAVVMQPFGSLDLLMSEIVCGLTLVLVRTCLSLGRLVL